MTPARLALALIALLPFSAFVSAQPASAQANCRWDLDGLWVGQRNGWRVNIKARSNGYVVWADGAPEPGQGVGDFVYKETGLKVWTFTHSSGGKATMRLDAAGLLQTTQPEGPETFKRVRPATPPKCVPLAGATPAPARTAAAAQTTARSPGSGNRPAAATPAAPSLGYNAALAAPTRMVRGLNLEDVKAIMGSEGYTITDAKAADGGIQVDGINANGLRVTALAGNCTVPTVSNCKDLSFMVIFKGITTGGYERATRLSQQTNLFGVFYSGAGILVAGRYVPIFSGVSMQYLRENLRSIGEQGAAVRQIAEKPVDSSGGI